MISALVNCEFICQEYFLNVFSYKRQTSHTKHRLPSALNFTKEYLSGVFLIEIQGFQVRTFEHIYTCIYGQVTKNMLSWK